MANISGSPDTSFGGTLSINENFDYQGLLQQIGVISENNLSQLNRPTPTAVPRVREAPDLSGGMRSRGPSGSYPPSLQPLIFLAAISGSPMIRALLEAARQDIADGARKGT